MAQLILAIHGWIDALQDLVDAALARLMSCCLPEPKRTCVDVPPVDDLTLRVIRRDSARDLVERRQCLIGTCEVHARAEEWGSYAFALARLDAVEREISRRGLIVPASFGEA